MDKRKIFNMLLVISSVAFFAFFTLSCAGDDGDDGDDGLSSNLISFDLNYWDHGMVNVTGNTGTTKMYSFLPAAWISGMKNQGGPGGVRIDDYMFYFDAGTSSVLTVKDLTSRVSKNLEEADKYRTQIDADIISPGKNIWTVLRGFIQIGADEYGKPTYKRSYRLVVRSCGGVIKYFDVNVIEAFEEGKKLELKYKGDVCFPIDGIIISLIRIPSLEPNPESINFGCNDFAAVVYAPFNQDQVLNTRYIQYDPCPVDKNQPGFRWIYQPLVRVDQNFSRFIGNLSNISATTRISPDGYYCVLISATSWAQVERKYFRETSELYSFVGSNMAEFAVKYDHDSGKYELAPIGHYPNFIWLNKFKTLSFPRVHEPAHNTIVASFAQELPGQNKAAQILAVVDLETKESPVGNYVAFMIRAYLSFYAVFDWNEEVLGKYNIAPELDLTEAQVRAGEGSIVLGMVLSVPPNAAYKSVFKPIGQEVDKYASVTFTDSITTTNSCGTKTTTGNGIDVQLGGITIFPSFALGASKSWSYTQGTTQTTSLRFNSDWFLEDCRGNQVITLSPNVKLKSAVLQGRQSDDSRANVRYYGQPPAEKPYVITTAVMGERTALNYRYGITDMPGYDLNSPSQDNLKRLTLTEGMTPYRVDQTDTGMSYMNIINSLVYLSSEGGGKIIPVIAKGNSYVGSDAGSSSQIEIFQEIAATTEATQSWKCSMTLGVENIASVTGTVNGEFNVSESNSTAKTVGWIVKYLKELKEEGVVKVLPDVFWIPVAKLKAKYGTREPAGFPENLNLKFIPDYMWSNNMDYWLLAYTNMKVESP